MALCNFSRASHHQSYSLPEIESVIIIGYNKDIIKNQRFFHLTININIIIGIYKN